jgi:hypothetical protein
MPEEGSISALTGSHEIGGAGGHSEPLSPVRSRRKTRLRRAIAVIATVVIVIVATALVYTHIRTNEPSASSYPSPPSGWVTLDTAWSDVSNGFSSFAQGPWTISFAEGAAADQPWSPPALLWALFGTSYAACADQLSGISTITFWNASSYPYSDAPTVYSSGAAPLWTFIFNGTGTPTFVASWDIGHLILNGALSAASPCMSNFLFNSSDAIHPSAVLDSDQVAAEVVHYDQLGAFEGPTPMPRPPSPAFALYMPGQQLLPSIIGGGNPWTVAYGSCGLPGQLGVRSNTWAYMINATSVQTGTNFSFSWSSSENVCYDSLYQILFNQSQIDPGLSPENLYHEWILNASFFSSAVPPTWTGSELTTSLIPWGISDTNFTGSGPSLSSTAALCGPGTTNISKCLAPKTGWYVALLGQDGRWLDSYPSAPNGTAWTVPDVPITTGDRLLLVTADALPGSDYLGTPSLVGEPAIFAGTPV